MTDDKFNLNQIKIEEDKKRIEELVKKIKNQDSINKNTQQNSTQITQENPLGR